MLQQNIGSVLLYVFTLLNSIAGCLTSSRSHILHVFVLFINQIYLSFTIAKTVYSTLYVQHELHVCPSKAFALAEIFPVKYFFSLSLSNVKGLRVEGVVCCINYKGKFVIWGYLNKIDIIKVCDGFRSDRWKQSEN